MSRAPYPYLTAEEVGRLWGVSGETVRRLIRAGALPGARRVGGRYLVPREQVDARPREPVHRTGEQLAGSPGATGEVHIWLPVGEVVLHLPGGQSLRLRWESGGETKGAGETGAGVEGVRGTLPGSG